MRLDVVEEIRDGFGRRAFAEDVRFQHRRSLPARLQDQRTIDFPERGRRRREVGKSCVVRGECHGEAGLGKIGVRLRHRFDEPQGRKLVRFGGKQPVELEKGIAQRGRRRRGFGKHPLELGLEVVADTRDVESLCARTAGKGGDQLLRTLRGGVDFAPQARRLDGERARTGAHRDFGGALGKRGIARFACRLEIRARCERGLPPLKVHELG